VQILWSPISSHSVIPRYNPPPAQQQQEHARGPVIANGVKGLSELYAVWVSGRCLGAAVGGSGVVVRDPLLVEVKDKTLV
jgi:hypothetical protein